ncbi:hypothetical protein BDV33DRAFT_232366 [Aspergillus novoparasiticus]|uniref:Peptidase C13 family-domain-containing protein n=1 Tax=Aspergillus novoparasiticus TaxID=986946 RepID=A0A5N6ELE6_9EURO|nr:hypothetical protein BDV33DRAFT_232366 [Aspergillus novoparasiticus]
MFVTSTPPVIHDNTIIVAATHPNVQTCIGKGDDWFLSDFYAFNYLLKGLGSSQTWLTAANPQTLVKKYGPFLHGNPYEDRKVVLSQELLDSNAFTPVTIVKTTDMIDRFLHEIQRASKQAKHKQAPLLILVFSHGFPDFQLLLNNGDRKRGLSITRLKAVLEPGISVTLTTTACFSGGWVTSPDFNHTTMAAATADVNESGWSNAWPDSHSMGRACGSVFASILINTLTTATSPLVTELNLASVIEGGSEDLPQRCDQLQPEEPSPEQTLTYNAFCHEIWRTCATQINQLWTKQHFTFSAQDDQWEYSWTGRTGIPLAEFEQRWNRLVTYPYTGPENLRAERSPAPTNNGFIPGSSFNQRAGIGSADDLINAMTDNICHGRIKEMAFLFRQTCPGDWTHGQEVGLGRMLRGYYEFDEFEDRVSTIVSTIRFRWEMGLLTDYIVDMFKLPMPNNQICLLWDRWQWVARIQTSMPDWMERRAPYYNTLRDNGFKIEPPDDQGPPFERPVGYLAASLLELQKPEAETLVVVSQILEFVERMKLFHAQRVAQDERVRHRGRAWLKSLGRHIRRSLSPRKKISTST